VSAETTTSLVSSCEPIEVWESAQLAEWLEDSHRTPVHASSSSQNCNRDCRLTAITIASIIEHTRKKIPAGAIFANTRGGNSYYHAKIVLSRLVGIATTTMGGLEVSIGAMTTTSGTSGANLTWTRTRYRARNREYLCSHERTA